MFVVRRKPSPVIAKTHLISTEKEPKEKDTCSREEGCCKCSEVAAKRSGAKKNHKGHVEDPSEDLKIQEMALFENAIQNTIFVQQ